MKTIKCLLTILTVFSFISLNAQEGTIIYHEPDTCFDYTNFIPYGSFVAIDIDGDGTDDMGFLSYEGDMYSTWLDLVTFADWRAAIEDPAFPYSDSIPVQLDTLQYWNDTIGGFIPHINIGAPSYIITKVFLRRQVGDNYYYAWVKTDGGWNEGRVYACVEEFAYCSIPNYPLHWGQTEYVGVEENAATAFATLHPNPTTGKVVVTGEGLRHAEAVNVLGQRVATATGEGNQLTIDLGGLPPGIYFVTVADAAERKCVHKVVKE